MSSEWRECTLGELVNIKHGFAFSGEHISKNQGKRVLVTPGNFEIGGGFKEGNAKYFHGPYPEEYVFAPSDLIVTMTDLSKTADTLGYSAKIPREESKIYLHNQRVGKVIAKSSDANLDFLYWVMRHKDYRNLVVSTATGSTVRHTSPSRILAYSFLLPPPSQQQAIAHILGTLDDKIELNRKTNETLEAMAKTLFKSWFVDFDPVRAKAEGRTTGLPAEISDLFPDAFEDSDLGEIPSGWRISSVNDLCEWVSSGGTPSRSRKAFWQNGTIPWFKTGELNDAPLLDSAEKINELALGNSSCKYWEAGTILFAIYASPTVGRLGLLTESGTSNQAAAGLKAKGGIGTPFLRRTLLFSRDELQNIAVGAAQQNINVQILKDHKVIAPDSSLATVYSKTISPLDEQQICLAKSTRDLCLLRDALLPKLISGEIRIPDAEKILEKVGI